MHEVRISFGQLVKSERTARGLTQAQVACRVGISRLSLLNIENGVQLPNLDIALRLAVQLRFSLDQLQGQMEGWQRERDMEQMPEEHRTTARSLIELIERQGI
jgi:transcriptional regulator with XRE-family HTH domain